MRSALKRAVEQQCRCRLITFLAYAPGKPWTLLHERSGIERLFQPRVAHANRSIRLPCRLKRHSRGGFVGLMPILSNKSIGVPFRVWPIPLPQ